MRDKKNNILTLVLSEKKILNETKNHNSPLQVKWSVPKPTHHILKYLKENLENKLNGMVRILRKHGEFNRVEFGNALWTSVIRPCITYGCSIWIPSSEAHRNLLQIIQYKAEKIILRTKINIPISALLLELGWEPINGFFRQAENFLFFKIL